MINVPLMLIPFALYNALILGTALAPWDATALEVGMPSGAELTVSMGEVLVLCGLGALLLDLLKAARAGASARLEVMLSGILFLVFAVELLAVEGAATSTFLMLMALTLIDGLASSLIARRNASGGRLSLEAAHHP